MSKVAKHKEIVAIVKGDNVSDAVKAYVADEIAKALKKAKDE